MNETESDAWASPFFLFFFLDAGSIMIISIQLQS